MKTLSLDEIARRLYKRNWADMAEYKQALRCLGSLSEQEFNQVKAMGAKYNV